MVARPQLKAVDNKGKPILLKAALATNRQPRNSHCSAPTLQKKIISAAVCPVAANISTINGDNSHNSAHMNSE